MIRKIGGWGRGEMINGKGKYDEAGRDICIYEGEKEKEERMVKI